MIPDSSDEYRSGKVSLRVDHFDDPKLEDAMRFSVDIFSIQVSDDDLDSIIEVIKEFRKDSSYTRKREIFKATSLLVLVVIAVMLIPLLTILAI